MSGLESPKDRKSFMILVQVIDIDQAGLWKGNHVKWQIMGLVHFPRIGGLWRL